MTGLPRSPKGHEAIWEIVDRMTKTTHFILVKMTYSLHQLAQIYIDEIVSLHKVPASIVSDRDPRFTSKFWESLHKALGTNLNFYIAFHPQTDGLSERTIRTLEDMLRACVLDFKGSWKKYLSIVEFPIIIATTLVLRWLPMRRCTVENAGPHFVGKRLVRGSC